MTINTHGQSPGKIRQSVPSTIFSRESAKSLSWIFVRSVYNFVFFDAYLQFISLEESGVTSNPDISQHVRTLG